MKKRSFARQLEEESPVIETVQPAIAVDAPEYNFEGFTIVINEKIVLTPIQREKKKSHG